MNDNHLLAAALSYAKEGWPVFPLVARTKQPIAGVHGQKDASTDEKQIRLWFADNPRLNLAIATGNGLLVIDVDVKNGASGEESLLSLQHEIGVLPDTRAVLSGSGGRQLYYRVPVEFESIANLAHGVEVKGTADAITVPPSIHPDTGRAYLWDGAEAFRAPLAELPAAWLERIRSTGKRKFQSGKMPAFNHTEKKTYPAADLARIVGGCTWLRHCRDDAAHLVEPEWYAMLTVVGRAVDGKEHAHAWSKPYLRYRPDETDAKLKHALTDTGPVTCQHVAGELGQHLPHCSKCRHWEKIESPITLGHDASEREDAVPDDEPWRAELTLNGRGRPYPNLRNAAIALSAHPDWQNERLAFDEFREKIFVRAGGAIAAGEVDEYRVLAITRWLQEQLSPTMPEASARSAVEYVARQHLAHPLREWLDGLIWDKTPRIRNRFWETYFGARPGGAHRYKDDADFYFDAVARCFFTAAVARVMKPGTRMEHLLVLEGPHTGYKQKALEVLAGSRYFTNQLPPRLDWGMAAEQIRGMWLVQISDLALVLQYEAARQFLMRVNDQYRPSYGKLGKVNIDRQCVFVATTAERRYLLDEHSIGYVWPVLTGDIDIHALARDRIQLWAEAVTMWREKTPWWPLEELAALFRAEQEARLIDDPWMDRVRSFTLEHPKFSVAQFLEKYEVPFHLQDKRIEQRIERLLIRHGYRHGVEDTGEITWRNPEAAERNAVVQ